MLAKYAIILHDGKQIIENNNSEIIQNQRKMAGYLRHKFKMQPVLEGILNPPLLKKKP